jgi:hypothetical protein
MNAYELADIVDKWAYSESAEYLTDAANLLRQQADRIDRLEREAVAKNNYLEQHCQKIDQQADLIRNLQKTLGFLRSGYQSINLTPQTKPLSDEEIHQLANKHLRTKDHDGAKVVLGLEDFARAIEERHGIK